MNMTGESFQYDPLGRRVAKSILTTTTRYLYDGANPVQELSGSTPTANFIAGGVDEYFQRTDSVGAANFMTDVLGSTLALTNSSGTNLAQYTYEPFGNTTVNGGSASTYQYTGRENDGTGVYFYRARYYSPTLQRFISEDPIGFLGSGPNLYAYASNSPTNFGDPGGTIGGVLPVWSWLFGPGAGNPLPGRKDNGSGSVGTDKDTTQPNPVLTLVADAIGVAGTITRNTPLGAVSAAVSLGNDPSPENLAVTGLGFVPGLDVAVTVGSAAWDGANFVTNQGLAPMFNAAPPQMIDNGYGQLVPNPGLMDVGDVPF
jgi:RHS repeat-associated protein